MRKLLYAIILTFMLLIACVVMFCLRKLFGPFADTFLGAVTTIVMTGIVVFITTIGSLLGMVILFPIR